MIRSYSDRLPFALRSVFRPPQFRAAFVCACSGSFHHADSMRTGSGAISRQFCLLERSIELAASRLKLEPNNNATTNHRSSIRLSRHAKRWSNGPKQHTVVCWQDYKSEVDTQVDCRAKKQPRHARYIGNPCSERATAKRKWQQAGDKSADAIAGQDEK